ncbi:MAG: hydroxyethylthiazole kinase [Armatimonadota bacterium]|nr:hydroxyethylthiazole kinase [Armatimonadota bacterium]
MTVRPLQGPSPSEPWAGPEGGIGEEASRFVAAVRQRRPLVHHFANFVTMQAVANVTRAVGALPVMALARDDAEQMAARADALVLNLGTPTPERLDAMAAAGAVAAARRIPIVLDPVGAGATAYRDASARSLIERLPIAVVRANRGEAAALLGESGRTHGVEAIVGGPADDGEALAARLAGQFRCVAAVTGARDHVTGGTRRASVEHGHPWLEAVSGAGCMVTALVGVFCAVTDDHFRAAVAALTVFGVAAERAARAAAGPGTLVPALLDALYHLGAEHPRPAGRARGT